MNAGNSAAIVSICFHERMNHVFSPHQANDHFGRLETRCEVTMREAELLSVVELLSCKTGEASINNVLSHLPDSLEPAQESPINIGPSPKYF